jgi:hypothetical protein
MAAGSGRLDLCLIYEEQKYLIELKIRYGEKKYIYRKKAQIFKKSCMSENLITFVFDY